ncbi:hypothetical protein CKAH01_10427 [Colletotrichum kahawae]|uniref:Uncharacterized protein n=1 Tax=Colletotrichum kahawae TaxID=34407 RepID=A0AAD9XXH0_COLKA|nr:hypothetical protein CKAH01_10427 [Colletotrichum kahawae]
MDDENPHDPEIALQQLTALESIPVDSRPTVLKRVTGVVRIHLNALIKSQNILARNRLALEADKRKLAEDTSLVCKVIHDTIVAQHEGVIEKLANPMVKANEQLTKCLDLQNDIATAIGCVPSTHSITKIDKKVNDIASTADTMKTAVNDVSSAKSVAKIDKKVDTLTTKLGELQLTESVTAMSEKVDSAVSTFNTATSALENVKPALDNVNKRFEAIDKAKKSEESSTMGKFDSFQKFLEAFAKDYRQFQEKSEKTATSRYNAIVATAPAIEGTVVPWSQVIAMELKKDNELLKSEYRNLNDKNNQLRQERERVVTELSGSTSNETRLRKENNALKEKFEKANDSLLATLDVYQKVQQKLLDLEKPKKDTTDEQIQGISVQVSQMVEMATDRVKHLESKVEDLTARLEAARDDRMAFQLEAESSKNRLRDYRQDEAIYKSNVKTLKTYADDLKDELKEARLAQAEAAEERKKMSEARENEAARVAQLQKDVQAAKDTAHSHKTESDRLTRELKTTKTRLQDAHNTSQVTHTKLEEWQNKLHEANEQLKEMQSKLGEEQQKLQEATADLDQKRAMLLELE